MGWARPGRPPAAPAEDRPVTERQRAAVVKGDLVLCAGGCGNPGKRACERSACRDCCARLGSGVDCGCHAPKKKRKKKTVV